MLEKLGQGPLIFNLGHGILPTTPIAHVERMLKRVRGSDPYGRGWPATSPWFEHAHAEFIIGPRFARTRRLRLLTIGPQC